MTIFSCFLISKGRAKNVTASHIYPICVACGNTMCVHSNAFRRNFSIVAGVARSQTKRSGFNAKQARGLRLGGRLELINYKFS